MATTQLVTDWKKEWFEIEDATYLNTAAHAAMPRVTLRAVQSSIEADKPPASSGRRRFLRSANSDSGVPLENDRSQTGRNRGHGRSRRWACDRGPCPDVEAGRRGHHGQRRIPGAIRNLEAYGRTRGREIKIAAPRDRFFTADDLIAAMTPRTRVVSVSHVRFHDASLLDAASCSCGLPCTGCAAGA